MDPELSIFYQGIIRRNEQLALRSVWEFLVNSHKRSIETKGEDSVYLTVELLKLAEDLKEIVQYDLDQRATGGNALLE